MAWLEELCGREWSLGLVIVYKHTELIHRALGLPGSPVPQGPMPQASGQLVSGVPDRGVNCVEDAQSTVGTTVEYFHYMFHRLSERTFLNLLQQLKQLFPPTDPWVQALPGPLGIVFEVRGDTVRIIPQMIPFKYP